MKFAITIVCWVTFAISILSGADKPDYVIVDTGQNQCYNNSGKISFPKPGQSFFGQDAEYLGIQPSYKDNHDGTITDINTGLMWTKVVDSQKQSLKEATITAQTVRTGGYSDWRVPNIKELYSLIDFRGKTGKQSPHSMYRVPYDAIPYINTDYFDFKYGDTESGERFIDAQWLSSTKYVSTTMNGAETLFGVNFADGRIKGYGYKHPNGRGPGKEKKFYVRYVRGNNKYGINNFQDNQNGTITDLATGLTWMKSDSGRAMSWQVALNYAEKLKLAGHSDWRLPNAKELQSIVDYTRSPDTTRSPSINPIFKTSSIKNEAGQIDYPYFWTSTTHKDGRTDGSQAVYIAFGRALGKMHGNIIDVHGAGAQRSDPKTGRKTFRGPQGDALRINNYVRCVRGGKANLILHPPVTILGKYPYNQKRSVNNFDSNSNQPPIRHDKHGPHPPFPGPPF